MLVEDIVNELHLNVFSGKSGLKKEVNNAYVSDLLSDVMGNAEKDSIWITLQTHKNVMAIASLKELSAVILVKGLKPSDDAVQQSEIEGIPILGTEKNTFEISGELFNLLTK